MVGTITPVVHGGRRSGWAASVAAHAAGATLSAAAFGAALGAIGSLLGAPWGAAGMLAVAAVATAYAARELLGIPLPVPQRRRQVPEGWREAFAPQAASFLYGLGLGIGYLTYLSYGTLVAVTAAAAFRGDPLTGALLVAPFGLARGLAIVVVARARTAADVNTTAHRLERLGATRVPRLVNGATLAVLAGAAGLASADAISGGGANEDLGRAATVVLAAVFTWAALAKVVWPESWRASLAALPRGAIRWAALAAVPLAETAVPVLALAGRPGAAARLALGLLVAFTGAIVLARLRTGASVPCGCFGRRRARDWRTLVTRNVALAALAAIALGLDRTEGGALGGIRFEALPAALAATGFVLGTLALRRAALLSAGTGPPAAARG